MVKGLAVAAVLPVIAVASAVAGNVPAGFGAHFTDRTMRVDFLHDGDARSETISIVRIMREGRWPGSRTHLIDPTNLGLYRAEVFDASGAKRLWSKGFNSYFGEYAATAAAKKGVRRAYEQTIRFPWPQAPVLLMIEKRRRNGTYSRVAETKIDPSDPALVRERPAGGVLTLPPRRAHDIHRAVDLVVLGEGYTRRQTRTFRKDLEHFKSVLFGQEPYASLRTSINVWGVLPYSEDPGCDEPGRGVWRRTALDLSFDSLGSPRYLLTENNRAVRDAAAHVPYDAIVIMVNHDRYGGGGIYNLYCVFTAHNRWTDYLFLHEFGHSFTGLADEYYSSAVAYEDFYPKGIEPPEPNITALLDPAHLKWIGLVTPGTPIPTPWTKAEYDRFETAYQKQRQEYNAKIAEAMRGGAPATEVDKLKRAAEKLSRSNAARVQELFAGSRFAGKVGAFEGAGYVSEGMYRPMLDCIMFSKGKKPYCKVCERAVRRMIEWRGE